MTNSRRGILGTIKRIRRRKRVKSARMPPRIGDEDFRVKPVEKVKEKKENITVSEEKSTSMVSFDHILTEFELKLRYLNLKDAGDAEFGHLFPPIKSKFIVIDDEGREYSVVRAGRNQISGDLYRLFNVNDFKSGDMFAIEYDREETKDGKYVIHIKSKK